MRYERDISPRILIIIYRDSISSASVRYIKTEMEFFARQEYLNLLDKRANGLSKGYRQNIAIIGDELIGKTCLIQYWLSKYYDNFTVPVYIEVTSQSSFSAFAEKFAGTLLFSFLKNSEITLRDDIAFLIDKSKKYIPHTCASIQALLNEKKKKNMLRQAFAALLELTEIFYKETHKSCIVVLDEFHLLEKLNIKDMYAHMRKYIMLHTHTMYILISSKKQLASQILSSDLNLLFGNFEKIELTAFDNRSACAYVRERLRGLSAPDEIKNFIINFCFSHPFYLNLVCNALIAHHTKGEPVPCNRDSFIASLENIFVDSWGILNRKFLEAMQHIESSFKDPQAVKILIALSNASANLARLAHQAGLPKKEVALMLNQFLDLDIISKNTDIYYISDRVFAFWLRCMYVHLRSAFSIDYDKQKQLFRNEMQRLLGGFYEAQAKAVSTRILELFNQFSDESIEMQKKRMRLHHFKEVKLLDIHSERIKEGILARAKNSLWIAGLKMEKTEEEDIIEFAGICKRLKYNKPQKRIFIAFDDIDINARLIAKEEKIITWDTAFINSLFDIFNKPRIVK